jgi:lipoprotein-anchoring transpeptidase ErfK/SrfK
MNAKSWLKSRGTGLGGLLVMCLLMVLAPDASGATRAAHVPRPVQQLAQLQSDHRVHSAPRAGAPITEELAAQRPITGERTEVPVFAQAVGPDGTQWLQVMLPGRPNGSRGWIARQGTRTSSTSWALTVDLGTRTVRVYRAGRLLRSFRAVVGKPSTPTPTGSFFVEETLQMYPGELGGPYALALSARSNALQEFEGGPGQIALHGRDGLGGTLGQAESHGCMRLATASIDWLAARIGPGTPVRIYAR